jgi:hypothetical protein
MDPRCAYGYSVYFGNHFVIPENYKQVFLTGDRSRGKWLILIFRKLWCPRTAHTELLMLEGRWVIQRLWDTPPHRAKNSSSCKFLKNFILFIYFYCSLAVDPRWHGEDEWCRWLPRTSSIDSQIPLHIFLQHWLHECAWLLRYTYIACLVTNLWSLQV